MDGGWPTESDDIILYEKLTSVSLQSADSDRSVFTATLDTDGVAQPVTLSVLTHDNYDIKSKFVQEAALLKLLNQRSFPEFVGICSVTSTQMNRISVKETTYPAFLTKKAKGVTLERFLLDIDDKNRRKNPYPYNDILDVLIDIADALQYLHGRRPSVIHRGLSTASIRVVPKNTQLIGQLHNFNNAILSAERGVRVPRLGIGAFQKEAIVNDELLTMEFFKQPQNLSTTNFPIISQQPQSTSPAELEVYEEERQDSSNLQTTVEETKENKAQNEETVSNNDRDLQLGTKLSSSSTSSNQNNWSFPDPKQKTECQKSALTAASGSQQLNNSIPSKSFHVSTSDFSSATLKNNRKKSNSLDCNNASVNDLPSSMVMEENPCSESSSLSPSHHPHHHNSNTQIGQMEDKWEDLELSNEHHDPISASVGSKFSSIWTGIVQTEIYRQESMSYLRKQAGVRLAPEVLDGKSYDTSMDIFSFGIVIFRALTKQSPQVQSRSKGNVQFLFPSGFPKEMEELIRKCCHTKAELRPTAKEIGDQLRRIQESGSLNILNKRWRLSMCFCGSL
eukprot:g4014.t1